MILPGVMTQPAACVAVFEKRPYWGPELQRQFVARNVLVRAGTFTIFSLPPTPL